MVYRPRPLGAASRLPPLPAPSKYFSQPYISLSLREFSWIYFSLYSYISEDTLVWPNFNLVFGWKGPPSPELIAWLTENYLAGLLWSNELHLLKHRWSGFVLDKCFEAFADSKTAHGPFSLPLSGMPAYEVWTIPLLPFFFLSGEGLDLIF